MSINIFTNEAENSLLNKFNGIFENMLNLHAFRAVVGYFRASGYFAIREHLMKVPDVKILVGIDVDHIIGEAQRKGLLFTGDDDKTRQEFINWIEKDIKDARYAKNVESGILSFIDDIINKRIEIRAHKSKQLHAKIYIFLPETFNSHTDGRLITGSSNLTSAGLGAKKEANNYEFNVEIKDYPNVKFALAEFEKLWEDSIDILPENFQSLKDSSHIDKLFTPFEIYIKFLIEYFGKSIEYDPETVGDVPNNFKKLSYQVDAVNQGFQMLMEHNGFFLADVVGTGKTVIAAMLAKRFIIANGTQHTKILVVYPPQVEKNWKRTFRLFNIDRYAKFITNGSLDKIIDGHDDYWAKEEYDLILVDEAHKFRNHTSQAFQSLQIICKAGRQNNGNIESEEKKIVLISATPLNNRPQDIYYLLQLFQDARRSTLPVTNLHIPGKDEFKYKFPQASSYKKGKPKFLFKKGKKDYFEIYGGVYVEGEDECEEDHPDISFFQPNSPEDANMDWLIMIMDAKFVTKGGKLDKGEASIFECIVRRFNLQDAPRIKIDFGDLTGIEGNSLLTNGEFHSDKTTSLKKRLNKAFIKEVAKFCPNEGFKVAG